MNQPTTDVKRARKSRRRLIAALGFGIILMGGLALITPASRERHFHGKPESQWITNIVYGMSLEHALANHADRIIPELRKAAEGSDTAGGYAKSALKNLESKTAKPRP